MYALWLLIGLLAGAAAVLVAVRPRLRSLSVEAARSTELERELVRVRAELERELVRTRPSSSASRRWPPSDWRR